jgi:predicted nuclease of predicted toxin-antitoxin system
MRLLLDECLPRKLKSAFSEHDCHTVSEAGWKGKDNGELLSLAEEAGFDVFLTVDQGVGYQQNLTNREIAVILVRARSNRLVDLVSCMPEIHTVLASIKHGQFVTVGSSTK